jgi:hypothetical protein
MAYNECSFIEGCRLESPDLVDDRCKYPYCLARECYIDCSNLVKEILDDLKEDSMTKVPLEEAFRFN